MGVASQQPRPVWQFPSAQPKCNVQKRSLRGPLQNAAHPALHLVLSTALLLFSCQCRISKPPFPHAVLYALHSFEGAGDSRHAGRLPGAAVRVRFEKVGLRRASGREGKVDKVGTPGVGLCRILYHLLNGMGVQEGGCVGIWLGT